MFGWIGGKDKLRAWSIGGAAFVHIGLVAWVLTLSIAPPKFAPPASVIVTFAEIADPPPEVQPPVDVELTPEPAVSNRKPFEEMPAPTPDPFPPSPPAPSQPSVLTQLDTADQPIGAGDTPSVRSEAAPVLEAEVIRTVLQNMSCQRLTMRRDEACPSLDPFEIAAASEARQTAPPAAPLLVGDYGPKTALERFASQSDRAPYLMPGMSADLFSDGLPKGSYNAQRIRNGQAPLWSKEIERGLRRED